MGDEKHGLLWVCRKETVIQFALGGFVEGAADLVEQQDVATVEQSAGDGDTLRLALAESAAALTQFGVDAVGQVKDEPLIRVLPCGTKHSSPPIETCPLVGSINPSISRNIVVLPMPVSPMMAVLEPALNSCVKWESISLSPLA